MGRKLTSAGVMSPSLSYSSCKAKRGSYFLRLHRKCNGVGGGGGWDELTKMISRREGAENKPSPKLPRFCDLGVENLVPIHEGEQVSNRVFVHTHIWFKFSPLHTFLLMW